MESVRSFTATEFVAREYSSLSLEYAYSSHVLCLAKFHEFDCTFYSKPLEDLSKNDCLIIGGIALCHKDQLLVFSPQLYKAPFVNCSFIPFRLTPSDIFIAMCSEGDFDHDDFQSFFSNEWNKNHIYTVLRYKTNVFIEKLYYLIYQVVKPKERGAELHLITRLLTALNEKAVSSYADLVEFPGKSDNYPAYYFVRILYINAILGTRDSLKVIKLWQEAYPGTLVLYPISAITQGYMLGQFEDPAFAQMVQSLRGCGTSDRSNTFFFYQFPYTFKFRAKWV